MGHLWEIEAALRDERIAKLERENAELREKVSDIATKLLDPLVDWNSHLRRSATSVPQAMTNQIDTASQELKRAAREAE